MRHSFKCSSNAFKVSLTNTYPVVEEKKMTSHFYNNRKFWMDKILNLAGHSPLTSHYFEPWYATNIKHKKIYKEE